MPLIAFLPHSDTLTVLSLFPVPHSPAFSLTLVNLLPNLEHVLPASTSAQSKPAFEEQD